MLRRMLLVFVSLSVFSSASSLSCRWMHHKFRQHSNNSLDLIERMAHTSTNTTEDAEVSFPHNLYNQASEASAEDKLRFTVQILEEMAALFEEDHSNASWEENTVDHFLIVVTQQADGLHSCIKSHGHKKKNKKLHMYFKRLSHILEQMGHSAESWELIRKEMKTHLMRADQLASSLLTN
ncbi:interferon phi 4 [Cyclopterus lumpus]|uniref:interferon a3-like n=1 Tax=Cyclopterus lumpus TaxID=8103 RepID=UPI001487449B|nr:interferon a3-like [Cyclopterus lumpus]XP_034414896.1 interferon phi 4 [Cyclopterus lumpus]